MSTFESSIREIVKEEIALQSQQPHLQAIEAFCEEVGLSRTTLWRQEKQGKVKIHRIGTRCFVNANDFIK